MYTTDALVCGSFDRNAADKSYLLFTESLGMVYATARSAREERSRQRFALQDFSFVRVSLVKGKGGWRVGSVVAQENVFQSAIDRDTRGRVIRIVRVLRRFVSGEEPAGDLYTLTAAALRALGANHLTHPDAFVDAVTFRMLYQLGYIAPRAEHYPILTGPIHTLDRDIPSAQLRAIRTAIEKAATASQL